MSTILDHDWIVTYTGRKFWLENPKPESFHIRDIAHSLANQCRFTGHVRRFYSIAEHSVRMVRFVAEKGWAKPDQYTVLMHDATEAYLTDVASPYKRMEIFRGYRLAEKELMRHIADRFDFEFPFSPNVKYMDNLILRAEARDLSKQLDDNWYVSPTRQEFGKIRPWRPWWAERQFLKEYERLTPQPLAQSNFFFFGLFLRQVA